MPMAEPNPLLPLFFRELVPLDSARHGELKMQRGREFGFARDTNAVPIAIHEIAPAAADYPIVFGGAGQPTMLAIVGYRERENLFVDIAGTWRRGNYVPAYVRNYPFAFIEPPDRTLVLGFDPQAQCFAGKGGAALFEGGQPGKPLAEAVELCKQLYQSLRETATLTAALETAGVLVENSATIEFKQGGSAVLRGFRVIDQAKFDALPDATFLDWRKRGWLAAIYAHFASTARWARIVDLAAVERA
jgi:hypothetical protein